MCPDIEIGYVRRVLGEAMASEIKDRGLLEDVVDQWVLGQVLVSPMGESTLAEDWYETNRIYQERIQPPNDNYEDEAYLRAVGDQYASEDQEKAQRAHEVAEAIGRLVGRGLVDLTSDSGYTRYFGDLATYRMAVELSSRPV
jgi:hypothetical protein